MLSKWKIMQGDTVYHDRLDRGPGVVQERVATEKNDRITVKFTILWKDGTTTVESALSLRKTPIGTTRHELRKQFAREQPYPRRRKA